MNRIDELLREVTAEVVVKQHMDDTKVAMARIFIGQNINAYAKMCQELLPDLIVAIEVTAIQAWKSDETAGVMEELTPQEKEDVYKRYMHHLAAVKEGLLKELTFNDERLARYRKAAEDTLKNIKSAKGENSAEHN